MSTEQRNSKIVSLLILTYSYQVETSSPSTHPTEIEKRFVALILIDLSKCTYIILLFKSIN